MKGKVLGEFFWEILIGIFIVGIAGVFIVGFVRDLFTDVNNSKPSIAPPPSVSYVVPDSERYA